MKYQSATGIGALLVVKDGSELEAYYVGVADREVGTVSELRASLLC